MEVAQRIRLIRIIEKMEKNSAFSNKLGIKNTSEYLADFCFWVKSILGNYEITLHSYFLPGDIDWYGCRWTDVHCFSIVDCRWHYSIGDVTFIIDQEEKTNGI